MREYVVVPQGDLRFAVKAAAVAGKSARICCIAVAEEEEAVGRPFFHRLAGHAEARDGQQLS
jgi:hypothetical protein